MGCDGESLTLDTNGCLVCMWSTCPRPTAAAEILANGETAHIVEFDATGAVVQHPLQERLEGSLFHCTLLQELLELGGPPVEPGTYRVMPREHVVDGVSVSFRSGELPWTFEKVT
jgi:hypothetical protein